ncbi:MAG: hypothetical protein CBC42_03985 [Betaproteobacteria bacterium TMED82]|nr:MAG: hypothetical protein CBC42_03985 [Betaproteobacteria bacterium TMED82]|tara:strand:- start:46084 stop:46662 length:579 start_codon:yes stop_codon:yes gene_type:complete
MFSKIYQTFLGWAQKKQASFYLSLVSFTEAFVFPLPPDILLIPMCLGNPKRSIFFSILTTVFSVLGGCVGYLIGIFLFDSFSKEILSFVGQKNLIDVKKSINEWGVFAILISAFTPLPYKVFCIGAGLGKLSFLQFFLGSVIGRGLRFLLIGLVIYIGGVRIEKYLRSSIEYLGWLILLIIFLIYLKKLGFM